MENFTNPYRFIKLASEPYYLPEKEAKMLQYVHDIPYKDSLSGSLTIKFKACTPLSVRMDNSGNFVQYRNKYFIPGSTIRGMVRNVFAILTRSNIANFIDPKYITRCPSAYQNNRENKIDMTQAVFGYANSAGKLKSRLSFSNVRIKQSDVEPIKKEALLLSPNPETCPFYFDRDLMSGWKRYTLRENALRNIPKSNKAIQNSTFQIIRSGAELSANIRYFNLRPYELGALMYAIEQITYHTLGYAKPFGYGRISCEEMQTNLTDEVYDQCLDSFEDSEAGNNAYNICSSKRGAFSKIYDDVRYAKQSDMNEIKDNKSCIKNFPEIDFDIEF